MVESTEALISTGRGPALAQPRGRASEPRKEGVGGATGRPAAIRHPQAVTRMTLPALQLAWVSCQTESSPGYISRNRRC